MSLAAPPPFPPPPSPPYSPAPRTGRRKSGFAAAVLGGALVVGGAAGLGGAAAWSVVDDDDAASSGGDGSSYAVADTADRAAADGSVESVAASVLPSVVKLDVSASGASDPTSGAGQTGSGSGVVLNRDGLILTNDHVVSLAGAVDPEQTAITASFNDGTRAQATVVGTDPLTDTALVKVSDVADLSPITVGKSANLDVGEDVVAIGSPFGLDSTVTSGIVSALDRPVGVGQDADGTTTAYPAIQTDAAINPGNSGGALVDMDGNLVGINASIRTAGTTGGESGSIGLGFAIPIDEIMPIVDQLEAGEPATHARLGIEVTDAGAQGGQSGNTEGAAIRSVADGTAADDAGLREGDTIVAIDDHRVSGADALVATVRAYRPGETVTVTYQRDGDEESTDLELGSDATDS